MVIYFKRSSCLLLNNLTAPCAQCIAKEKRLAITRFVLGCGCNLQGGVNRCQNAGRFNKNVRHGELTLLGQNCEEIEKKKQLYGLPFYPRMMPILTITSLPFEVNNTWSRPGWSLRHLTPTLPLYTPEVKRYR